MTQVNVHEAKTHLSRLLARVAAGEEILIAKGGEPIARLVPCRNIAKSRIAGRDRGRVKAPPDFDAPLPKKLLRTFQS